MNRLNRALVEAVAAGDMVQARACVARGADVNYRNRDGETALAFAAAWDQRPAVDFLLAHGADPNAADRTGGTPLMLAAQHGSPALVRTLLAAGADPAIVDRNGHAAAIHADWRGAADRSGPVIRRLLAKAGTRSPVTAEAPR